MKKQLVVLVLSSALFMACKPNNEKENTEKTPDKKYNSE